MPPEAGEYFPVRTMIPSSATSEAVPRISEWQEDKKDMTDTESTSDNWQSEKCNSSVMITPEGGSSDIDKRSLRVSNSLADGDGLGVISCNGNEGHRQSETSRGSQDADAMMKSPPEELLLDKSLVQHEKIYVEMNSLREATKDALQFCREEKERLCMAGEALEARVAYMKRKVQMAEDELREKGIVIDDDDEAGGDDFRLSFVKEGKDETSGLSSNDSDDEFADKAGNPILNRPNGNQGPAQRNGISKRFSLLSQLQGSYTTKCSQDSFDSNGVPQISRGSLIGMLGASKGWLDQSTNENTDESTRESVTNLRFSFVGGDVDGMPSRWKAREREREKSARQKERDEERKRQRAVDQEEIRKKRAARSNADVLRDLIAQREGQISTLEGQLLSHRGHALREEVSVLQKKNDQAKASFEQEQTRLINELRQVNLDNERLDRRLLEEAVSTEAKKIIIEILADELKHARADLAEAQADRDKRLAEQKRKERAARWSWLKGSNESKPDQGYPQHHHQQQKQTQQHNQQQQRASQSQGDVIRYQVPTDAAQQYRDLSHGSDEDSESDGDGGVRERRRKQRSQSISSIMSSITMESGDMIDILEQLELNL